MVRQSLRGANEIIEQELHERLNALKESFKSEMLSFNGALVSNIEDVVRDAVESMQQRSPNYNKMTVVLTTYGGYIEVVHRIVDTLRHHYAPSFL
jgi:hypothetical protein